MAANPLFKRAIGFGKRLRDQHSSGGTVPPGLQAIASVATRRGVHSSTYDKNPEDHVYSALVPDDVIQPRTDGMYWGPHPATGVFGPPDHHGRQSEPPIRASATSANAGSSSVLDQTAWFRPVDGVDVFPLN